MLPVLQLPLNRDKNFPLHCGIALRALCQFIERIRPMSGAVRPTSLGQITAQVLFLPVVTEQGLLQMQEFRRLQERPLTVAFHNQRDGQN
ncbi:hypothetical protein D3C76_1566710 [compost metagenome]